MAGLSLKSGYSTLGALSFGRGLSSFSGLSPYLFTEEALSFFAAMPTQPSVEWKIYVNQFIFELMSNGIWSKIASGNILCAQTQYDATIDFKTPTRVGFVVGSPTFTKNFGFTGTGAVSEFVNTNFNPATESSSFSLNSASICVGVNNNVQTNTPALTNGGAFIFARLSSNLSRSRINDATNSDVASTTSQGLFTYVRTASNATQFYKNGSALGSAGTAASTSILNATFKYLGSVGSASATNQVNFGLCASALSASEISSLHTSWLAMTTGIASLP